MILQPPTVMAAAECRSPHKITVASLCCDADEANSSFTASTEDHQSYGLNVSSTSYAAPTQAKYYQLERPGLAATLPLPMFAQSRYPNGFGLATQASPSNYFDATRSLGAASDVMDSTGGSVLQADRSVDQDADLGVQPTAQTAYIGTPQRVLRPDRSSYTDEQRFFILYYRIVGELSWPEIEVEIVSFFNLRTKDALTSVYYRTRKMWGMDKVLDTDLHSIGDRNRIESKASRFSSDFLADLGYFD
jgi:hypothetical protein